MSPSLQSLSRCFQGIIPGVIATSSADGIPNISFLSHIYYLDEKHLAVSCQFFNKTRRNLDENPYATVQMYDPLTFEAYKLRLRFDHSETEGPLFQGMALRIQAIAAHTGMCGVFRLRSADVFEVLDLQPIPGYLSTPAEPGGDPADAGYVTRGGLSELRALQLVSERINRARDLDELLTETLGAIEASFGFTHSMVLVPDETGQRLVALASRGYGVSGVGAEVTIGEGLIGAVASERRLLSVSGMDASLRYGRAVRDRAREVDVVGLRPEIPLPGLPNAASHMALPLVVKDRLVGVLAIESLDPLAFQDWHEAFMQVIANQIAIGLDRMLEEDGDGEERVHAAAAAAPPPRAAPARRRTFQFFRNDDCVFVDGEYLVRNVPGKILWKLLTAHSREGRTAFSNRELRLDPSLGLPAFKDNLESRLILLRKRLEQKCPDVRLVPAGRGRFTLALECAVDLVERETG